MSFIEELKKDSRICEKTLKNLAHKAYSRTAAYDATISNWMNKQINDGDQTYKSFGGEKIQTLRYGENPHQEAAVYTDGTNRYGVISAEQIQGKELSYNNINDTDAAFELVSEFDPDESHAVAIIKHANPCGSAISNDIDKAFKMGIEADKLSAFGGIVALNRECSTSIANYLKEFFIEILIAPSFDKSALNILGVKKNLRIIQLKNIESLLQNCMIYIFL